MPSISFNITGSDITLSTNVSAGSQLTMSIQNPTQGASYFVLETVRNQDGFYDSSSPKNTSGSFELKSGIIGLVSDDYKMGAVVQKGSSELIFTPAINVVGNTVKVRGVSGIQLAEGGFDADYQAVLNYATTQGYTLPSAGQQLLQNQLVVDLKDGGIWAKLDTFYAFATDGDSDFASINWKDPNAFELLEVNSPTFTTNVGFTGDGVSSYLDPSYNQGTDGVNWSNPNGSFGILVDTPNTTNARSYVGYDSTTTTIRRGTAKLINSFAISVTATTSNNFIHINVNSTQASLFYNGVQQATSTGTFVDTGNMTFLAEGGITSFGNATISIGFFGGDLESEQSDFYTAVNSYMTSI